MEPRKVMIAVLRSDGGVGFTEFQCDGRSPDLPFGAVRTNDPRFWFRDATPENIAAEVAKTYSNPSYALEGITPVSWRVVDLSEIPKDRTYRNALTDTGTAIVHDMPTARAIHLEKLRQERAPRLAELDIEWSRAAATGGDAQAVENERQALRDMPERKRAALDAAKTVDELKAVKL